MTHSKEHSLWKESLLWDLYFCPLWCLPFGPFYTFRAICHLKGLLTKKKKKVYTCRESLWEIPPKTRSWGKNLTCKAIQDTRDPPGWPWPPPHPVSSLPFCCCSCLPCCRFLCCLLRSLLFFSYIFFLLSLLLVLLALQFLLFTSLHYLSYFHFHHYYLELFSCTNNITTAFMLASWHLGLEIKIEYYCTLYNTLHTHTHTQYVT